MLLDQWRTDDSLNLAPRLYQRLQAAVRVAEATLAGGGADPESTQFLGQYVDLLQQQMADAKTSLPTPVVPTSLARARAGGEQPDATVEAAAATLISEYRRLPTGKPADRKAAATKLVQAFLKAAAGKSAFAVESALVNMAPTVAGSVDELGLLGTVLTTRDVKLVYTETRFLGRLIDQAATTPADMWPSSLARSAVDVVVGTEQAWADPNLEAWAMPILMACARQRWEGERLFRELGRVPEDTIAQRFDDADRLAGLLTTFRDTLHAARTTRDTALVTLIPELDWVARNPDRYPLWEAKVRATAAILPLLRFPNTGLDEAGLQTRTDQLRGAAVAYQQCDKALSDVSGGPAADWLLASADRPSADAALVAPLARVSELPALPPERRAAFQAALAKLAAALNDATLALDKNEDAAGTATEVLPITRGDRDESRRAMTDRAAVRARGNIAYLRLAGLADAALAELTGTLDTAVKDGPASPAWSRLAADLARAWTVGLADRLAAASTDDRASLAAIYPGSIMTNPIDTPSAGVRAAFFRQSWERFYTGLAATYQYAARSGIDAEHMSDLAQAVGAVGAGSPPLELVAVTTPVPALPIRANQLTNAITFGIVVPSADAVRPTVRPLVSTATLSVSATIEKPTGDSNATDGPTIVRVIASLRPGTPAGEVPTGFVVELSAGDWATFVPVSLDTTRLVRPLDLLVDRVPTDPVGLGSDVRVRPGAAQAIYLFARNLTQSPEKIQLNVVGPNGSIGGNGSSMTLAPGATVPATLIGRGRHRPLPRHRRRAVHPTARVRVRRRSHSRPR